MQAKSKKLTLALCRTSFKVLLRGGIKMLNRIKMMMLVLVVMKRRKSSDVNEMNYW